MKLKNIVALTVALALSQVAMCDQVQPAATDTARPITDPQISTFSSLVDAAGLHEFFQGTGPFTAFVPSNEAFEKFGKKKIEELEKPEKLDELISFVNHYITLGMYLSKNLKTRKFRAVNGQELDVRVENGEIWVNNAKVIRTDLVGPNGVIHVIDRVLD